MPDIFLLRHGKAEPDSDTGRDVDRPLAEKGIRSSRALPGFFRLQDLAPEVVLCSAARRTRETFEHAGSDSWSPDQEIFLKELYLASADRIFDCLVEHVFRNQWQDEPVLIVGHNPGLTQLATYWMGRNAPGDWMGMKVGSLAHFHFPGGNWTDILEDPPEFLRKLEFRNYWTPKMIFAQLGES